MRLCIKIRKIFFFSAVEVQLYSPNRPVVDLSACFLWIMAVGTIVCASLWSEFVACEQVDERYNQLTHKVWTCVPYLFQPNVNELSCWFVFLYAYLNKSMPICFRHSAFISLTLKDHWYNIGWYDWNSVLAWVGCTQGTLLTRHVMRDG